MKAVTNIDTSQADFNFLRNFVNCRLQSQGVQQQVQHPTVFQPWGLGVTNQHQRHIDANGGVGIDALEIQMQDAICYGVKLDVTGDSTHRLAINVQIKQLGVKARLIQRVFNRTQLNSDRQRFQIIAIHHGRN